MNKYYQSRPIVYLIGITLLFSTSSIFAATGNTWTGAGGATWDVGTTASWTSPTTWSNTNAATFGTLGAGSITISASGGAVAPSGTSSITANGYTFSGASVVFSSLSVGTGISAEFDDNFSISSGGNLTVNGGTLTLTGGGTFGGATYASLSGAAAGGTITFTAGSYSFMDGCALSAVVGSTVTVNFTGTSSLTTGTAQFAVGYNGAATLNYSSTGTSVFSSLLVIGRAGSAMFTQTNGIIDETNNTSFAIQIANGGSGGELDLQGGVFALNGGTSANVFVNHNSTATGTLLVEGGAFSSPLISLDAALGGTANVSLTSGSINVDSFSVAGAGTNSITLSGGTISTDLSTSATWSPNITLGTGGNVTINAATAAGGTANITMSGILSGTGGFTSTGAGTLTLTGANNYSGDTTVNGGHVKVSGSGTVGAGNVLVENGGSLLFATTSATKSISGNVTLSGGTFGYAASSSGNTVATAGALTLNTSSTLDFGSGRTGSNNNTLKFSLLSSLAAGVNLTVNDYLTSATYALGATTASGASQDALQLTNMYGSSLGTQLSQIAFYNSSGTMLGYGEEVSFAGGFEIVPITATPEPSTILVGVVLLGLLGWSRWRFLKSF